MREILFRGKRLDNGEWVEGFYTNLGGKYHYILTGQLDITNGYPDLIKNPVHPDTVGQYTGLTDKNGKRIFEGDIVRYYEQEYGGGNVPVCQPVGYEEGGFCTHRYFLNNWLRNAVNGNIQLEEIEVVATSTTTRN